MVTAQRQDWRGPERLPLTPVQEDVLVESALEGGPTTQTGQARLMLPAGPAVQEVAAAWQRILESHPVLTVAIRWSGERPWQVVGAAAPSCTPAQAVDDTEARALREAALTDGFHPEQGPLLRLLCVEQAGSLELVLTFSRLVLDDRGAALLLDQLAQTVLDTDRGQARLPDVADYLRWREGMDRAAAERFWRAALAPLEGPAPLLGEGRGGGGAARQVTLALDPQLNAAVARLAGELGVPARWLALAAWSVVVAVFRGEPLAVVGAMVDCRPSRLERAIGSFELLLPVVSTVDATPVGAWLAELSATLRDVTRHAHVTGAELHAWSGVERGTALFDTAVDLRPDEDPGAELSGEAVAPVVLTLGGGRLCLRFDPSRLTADAAWRLVHHTALALAGLTGDGERAVDALPLVTDAQRAQLLADVDRTAAPYPSDRCLHQLFEAQAAATPTRTALVFRGETLTYDELNRRANRLAHHLVELGVRPDTVVGLCAEPGFDMILAILAILKAGGAYAPLDPSFPEDRLAYLVGDLRAGIVVLQPHLRSKLPASSGRLVLLDGAAERDQPEQNPDSGVQPGNLAYLMYTSGSTGRPKGVMVEHRGSVNYVWWMRGLRELGQDDASLQWTAYSFDAAVWELFWPLLVGGRAALAPARLHLDLEAFVELIQRERVTTLHFVPAMLQVFLSAPDVQRCRSLRYVFCSGEPIPTALVDRFHALLDAELINLYGVTEVSIDSTSYACPREGLPSPVPAGRALSNTAVYVLDRNLQPVPVGARGEVHIGGDSVTRGYLSRPALTADRFLPDPFHHPGARMYRTGDIGRLLPDGNLQFLGRSDHQVKIRGIRIELHEVEAELAAHPAVRECLVVPWGEGSERNLAAYVLLHVAGAVDERALREFLAVRLPEYMVPSAWLFLEAFPLNANGKIDRHALPPPASGLDFRGDQQVGPRTDTERVLSDIWTEVLGVRTIGVHDDFFSVGGNSLLATRVIARVRERYGAHLPLRVWLESGSIAELAAAVDRHTAVSQEALRVLDDVAALDESQLDSRVPGDAVGR